MASETRRRFNSCLRSPEMNGRHGPFSTIAVLIGRLYTVGYAVYTPWSRNLRRDRFTRATRCLLVNGRLTHVYSARLARHRTG